MRLSFRLKVFFGFLAVNTLLSGAMLWLAYRQVRLLPLRVTQGMFAAAMPSAALGFRPERIARLDEQLTKAVQTDRGADDAPPFDQTPAGQAYLQSPDYAIVTERLWEIDRSPPHFGQQIGSDAHAERQVTDKGYEKLLYLLVRDDEGRLWVAAALDPKLVGREIPSTETIAKGWTDPVVEPDLTRGPFGLGLGAYAPVQTEDGRTVALLGVHAPARPIQTLGKDIAVLTGSFFVAAILLAVLPAWLLSRKMNRPIRLLAEGMEKVAAGQTDVQLPPVHSRDEFESLCNEFNHMVRGLAERDRLAKAIVLAKDIQQHLLPQGSPNVQGLDVFGGIDYCDETGGDYYDFIELPDRPGQLGLAVGDICGHGLGAALLMASGRSALRSHAVRLDESLTDMAVALNEQLFRDTGEDSFMTLFYARLDGPARKLRYVSAGHDPAVLIGPEGKRLLKNSGIPLGVLPEAPFEEIGPVDLAAGDVLVVSTDGVREARNPAGEEFGLDCLAEVVSVNRHRPAREIYDEVLCAVRTHQCGVEQADDITLVIARIV